MLSRKPFYLSALVSKAFYSNYSSLCNADLKAIDLDAIALTTTPLISDPLETITLKASTLKTIALHIDTQRLFIAWFGNPRLSGSGWRPQA